jgi:hypothetical protein
MRTQDCRLHIDSAAEACGLEANTVQQVKQAAKFCDQHVDLSTLATKPILALIRIKDPEVKDRALLSISNALESGNHPISGKRLRKGRLTEADVKKVIKQKELELTQEAMVESQNDNHKIPQLNQKKDTTPIVTKTKIVDETEKISVLDKILKPEHISFLNAMVAAGEADDELDALIKILDTVCQG